MSDCVVLENDHLRVEIASLGAELKRIFGKKNGIEYLWKGDNPSYWTRSATLLFPFVGRLESSRYRYDGNEYEIPCHGFAKDSMFDIVEKNDSHVVFRLNSSDITRKVYPFDFSLLVIYSISDMSIRECVRVVNTSSCDMLFKLGFHPGFNVPLSPDECFEDYRIVFDGAATIEKRVLSSDKRLDLGYSVAAKELDGNTLNLNHELFSDDALVLSNMGKRARLEGLGKHYVELSFDTPYCGIWQTYSDSTPFVAIEPWYNLPGKDGRIEDLDSMVGINMLVAGEHREFSLSFNFG